MVNSLRKHDWVYRWEQVLTELGLPTTDGMEERKIYLQQLAQACLYRQELTKTTSQNLEPSISISINQLA